MVKSCVTCDGYRKPTTSSSPSEAATRLLLKRRRTITDYTRGIGNRFIDSLRLYVKGGAGGHGQPKYGGIGGHGGNVYFKAVTFTGLNSFLRKYPHQYVSAENGKNSSKYRLIGLKGADKIVEVPVGIIVNDECNKKIGELNEIGETIMVAEGGRGGSVATKPQFTGLKGQERTVVLDLKLIADVGLVGFPNAGKSTLLKAISRANPHIASYAFTTLKPNLGVLEYSDCRRITMADLPGLIEGASENLGMGHGFLKHVERTSMLVMVVDIEGFQYKPNQPYRSCLETVILLNKELELYDQMLVKKPVILALNKMDLPKSDEKLKEVAKQLVNIKKYVKENIPEHLQPQKVMQFEKVIPISARYNAESIAELKTIIRTVLDRIYFRSMKSELKKKENELITEIERVNKEVGEHYM